MVTLTSISHCYFGHICLLCPRQPERQPSFDERVAGPGTVLRRKATRSGGPEVRARHIHRSDGKGNQ